MGIKYKELLPNPNDQRPRLMIVLTTMMMMRKKEQRYDNDDDEDNDDDDDDDDDTDNDDNDVFLHRISEGAKPKATDSLTHVQLIQGLTDLPQIIRPGTRFENLLHALSLSEHA